MEPGRNYCCLTQRVFNKNDPVPLKSVSVDVRIEGYIANVRSALCYKNVEKRPIEARYEFPMDDQSTVYHFEAQIEDRIIIAECQEKEQAKETYDDAVKAGYGAVLMQEDDSSSDIFSCLVGNLPPDAEAVIKFGYVTELSLQPDGTLSFLLPTLLNPRYNPSVESGGSKSPLDVTYVSEGGEQPYKFDIKATIVNPGKIVSVKSPKDELNVKLSDDKTVAQVTLAKPFVADHDLTLDVTFEELNKPHLIIEKGDDAKDGILKKDVIMLNFFPELKDTDYTSKHEFIFVVDRSGSMEGPRIEGAKETLLLFLKSLPPGCYFNIVGFGSNFQLLFPDGSREYSEETLDAACEHQKGMHADLGGTEVLEPLKHIYDKPPMGTHNREILLLTDGDVMNTQAVIDLVKKNASNTRLFSFGIGEGASTSLVKGIARAGRGKAEFTKEGERLQPLVVKTLKAAMQLAVTDLHLDWQFEGGSCDLIQMPKDLPPLFTGERLIIYNVTSADKPLQNFKVQLKGQIGERHLEFGLDLDVTNRSSSRDETMPIHRLAAKAQIKLLQDAGKDENKTSIVLLSIAANVISCHTSMVGIDKNRKEKVTGDLMRRNVPMMSDPSLHSGWRNCCSVNARVPMPMALSAAPVAYQGRKNFSAKAAAAPPPPMWMNPLRSNSALRVSRSSDLSRQLEGDTGKNTASVMQHTVSTRNLDQPMSLEGQLEGDAGKNTVSEMQHTVSTRNLDQPMCLECQLEGNPSENTPEVQPAISTRSLKQPKYLEGKLLEEEKPDAASETMPPLHRQNSGPKPKVLPKTFCLFHKNPEKSSKVPDSGDPDKSRGTETGSGGASKAKGSCKLVSKDCYSGDMEVEVPEEPPKEPTYMTVVALQAFSGLWKLNAELAAALKTTLDALQNASPIKELDVWATVLALSYLEVKFGDKRDEWEMVEMKARQWLDLQDREGLSIDDLLQKAKAVVGQL